MLKKLTSKKTRPNAPVIRNFVGWTATSKHTPTKRLVLGGYEYGSKGSRYIIPQMLIFNKGKNTWTNVKGKQVTTPKWWKARPSMRKNLMRALSGR